MSRKTTPVSCQLLPASAAAFAPRASSVNIVLGSKLEPWLTQTLRRINRKKRPLNNVQQHRRCLVETLSSENAIWVLTSMMLPRVSQLASNKDDELVNEMLSDYRLVHVEAYVVHVDMVLRNEIAFKLTPDSIQALIDHHRKVYCVDIMSEQPDWPKKEEQIKHLRREFVQAVNKFVYRTDAIALEGLEEGGVGELLRGKSEEVQTLLEALFLRLIRPGIKVVALQQEPMQPPNSSLAIPEWWARPAQHFATIPTNHVSIPSITLFSNDLSMWPSTTLNNSFQCALSGISIHSPSHLSTSTSSSVVTAMESLSQLPLPSTYLRLPCGNGLQYGDFRSSIYNSRQPYAMI